MKKPIGRHRIHARRKEDYEISQLSLDAREAERNGFGHHYGQFMAAIKEGTIQRKLVETVEKPVINEEERRKCKRCGAPIYRGKNFLYCSDQCNEQEKNEKAYQKRKETQQDKLCEWCGKNRLNGYQKRYCSLTCSNEAVRASNRKKNLEEVIMI